MNAKYKENTIFKWKCINSMQSDPIDGAQVYISSDMIQRNVKEYNAYNLLQRIH